MIIAVCQALTFKINEACLLSVYCIVHIVNIMFNTAQSIVECDTEQSSMQLHLQVIQSTFSVCLEDLEVDV